MYTTESARLGFILVIQYCEQFLRNRTESSRATSLHSSPVGSLPVSCL